MTATDAEQAELRRLVDAANANPSKKHKNKLVGKPQGSLPRFELYHSAPSLCSHKVRNVLAEKAATYMSHDMMIMPAGKAIPQNYRPEYVRMRLKGAPGARLVDGFVGESSVTRQGFDPCVVPTLVDHEAARILVDSKAISLYIADNVSSGADLLPSGIREHVVELIDLVDQAPHVAALYGAHPDEDRRPEGLRKNITGVHAKKIRALQAVLPLIENDPELKAAYASKIAKEKSAGEFVCGPDDMRSVHRTMGEHVSTLEAQLQSSGGPWICGDTYTLADVIWAISLWRMKWLGFGPLWESGQQNAAVATYLEQAWQRPSFRSAVVDWPGSHSPSPHVPEYASAKAKREFMLHMFRSVNWRETLFGDPRIKLRPLQS